MDKILLFLLKKGALINQVKLSTTEIGAELGMSQQNVSRRLRLLEEEGKISRGKAGIMISDEGVAEIRDLRAMLENALSSKLEIRGEIVDGLGEGKFYLRQSGYRKQFKEKLGFDPYPGTLNIRLSSQDIERRRQLLQLEPVIIEGFEKQGRKFGDLFAYKAKVEGEECAIVVPLRTHHGHDVIEVAAAVNLKERLGKRKGEQALLEVG